MRNSVLVSIITPVYNSEKYLDACVESIIAQSYTNWELILVDDCSTDNSLNIIRRLASHEPRIRVYQMDAHSGAGPTRNKAIQKAEGDILAFLDSDDIWHHQKLEIHLTEMIKNEAVFSHTSYGFINEEGESIRKTFHVSTSPVSYTDLLKRTEISCLTAMYDVRKLGKMYMPDLKRKQDYSLWLAILKKGYTSHPVDVELAWYRQRADSATSNKTKLILAHWNFLRKHEKLPIHKSFFYFCSWIYNGLFKYYF